MGALLVLEEHARLQQPGSATPGAHQPDPHSPWQRATNENTNGLLRRYFPKGTDLSRWSLDDLLAVQDTLNSRPRKVLGWKTPAEVLDEQLRSLHHTGVATTG